MMRRLVVLFLLVVGLFAIGGTEKVSASTDDFVINSFKADYYIDNLKVGGGLDTTETIDLTYSDFNHGILRAIPQRHHGYKTKLRIAEVKRDGSQEPYTTYTENGNLVLKIGDGARTITGKHTYVIRYFQERIVDFGEKNQFYWDVNGTEWNQPFEHLEAHVYLKGAPLVAARGQCYTGVQGSTEHNCTMTDDGIGLTVSNTTRLNPGENLSVQIPLDGVAFVKPGLKEKITDNIMNLIGLGAGLCIATFAFSLWWRRGRDAIGSGITVPEYDPPKILSPAEVGMLADFKVDGRDVSATLIDMAVRRYIRLHEDHSKVLFFTSRSFSVELLNAKYSDLKDHERILLEAIFPDGKQGDIVKLKDLKPAAMQSSLALIRAYLKETLSKKYGYIEPGSNRLQTTMIIVGGVLMFLGFYGGFLLGIGFGVGIVGGGLAMLVFGFNAQRRSHAGVETYEKIMGLKLYMNTAEKDRLKMMQSVDRPYAEPSKTVELFEKLLPFAVALGVEDSWANQFDDVLTGPPDWYQGGSMTNFNAGYLASNLTSATQSFSKSFESSSGSSGGSSGGGGGGGGGGGW